MRWKEESQAGKDLLAGKYLAGKCLYLTGNHQAPQENIGITHPITVAATLGTSGQGSRSSPGPRGHGTSGRGTSTWPCAWAVCCIRDAL